MQSNPNIDRLPRLKGAGRVFSDAMLRTNTISGVLLVVLVLCCTSDGTATSFRQALRARMAACDDRDILPPEVSPPDVSGVEELTNSPERPADRSVTREMISVIRDQTRAAIDSEIVHLLGMLRQTTPSSRKLAQMKVADRNRYLKQLAQERNELIAKKNGAKLLLKELDEGVADNSIEEYIRAYWQLEDTLDTIETVDTRALAMRDSEVVAAHFANELTSEVGIIAAKIGGPTGLRPGEFNCEFTYGRGYKNWSTSIERVSTSNHSVNTLKVQPSGQTDSSV